MADRNDKVKGNTDGAYYVGCNCKEMSQMSNPKTENEIYELVACSRAEAERGNYAEAYRLIRDLPLAAHDLPEAVILKASLSMVTSQYEEALRLYDEVISVAEVCKSIHLNRIECLLRLGRLAKAEVLLEDEESLLHGHYGRHLMLARIAARRCNAALAIAHLKASYCLNPHALACATNFPEVQAHLWTIILNTLPGWRFNPAFVCLN